MLVWTLPPHLSLCIKTHKRSRWQAALSAAPPFRTTRVTAAAAETSEELEERPTETQIYFRFDRNRHKKTQNCPERVADGAAVNLILVQCFPGVIAFLSDI